MIWHISTKRTPCTNSKYAQIFASSKFLHKIQKLWLLKIIFKKTLLKFLSRFDAAKLMAFLHAALSKTRLTLSKTLSRLTLSFNLVALALSKTRRDLKVWKSMSISLKSLYSFILALWFAVYLPHFWTKTHSSIPSAVPLWSLVFNPLQNLVVVVDNR